jgi:hypothetical protein
MQPAATRRLFTCTVALAVACSGRLLESDEVARRSLLQRTVEPFPMDNKTFLQTVEKEPADIALLLYSPTCPDCQWFFDRWAAIGRKLQKIPSMVVWTVADPKFAAPGAFDHWHNPDIFFVPAKNKSHPVMLPEKKLGTFLAGDVTRPQATQDEEFEDWVVDWFGERASWPLNVQEVASPESVQAQKDLEALALKEWNMLQARWKTETPTPTKTGSTLTTLTNLKSPVETPEQRLEDYANGYVATFLKNNPDKASKYDKDYLYKYAVAYYRRTVYAGVKSKKPRQAVPMPKDLSLLKKQVKLHV